jgi:hypothetical protein
MADQRSKLDALLEREVRQISVAGGDDASLPTSRLNAVWRQKVIHWYFTLVAALGRQHNSSVAADGEGSASSNASDNAMNPFNRESVHVSASLLDTYLMSLPSERALRYKHDRPAYQLLATTCLLLGMRLAQHDQIKAARQQEVNQQVGGGGLKRAKTHMSNMNEALAAATPSSATAATAGLVIPNATTILRISAAPKAISEQHILSMVREMTGSRSFPRSKVVTALDFIQALSATRTVVSVDGSPIRLGPEEAEEASRFVDLLLRDVTFLSCRPSVVACAVITFALARSEEVDNLSLTSIRKQVYHSIFGPEEDPAVSAAVLEAESFIRVGVPSSRNNARARRVVPTTHLIPLEAE